jgi:hypothetical protein
VRPVSPGKNHFAPQHKVMAIHILSCTVQFPNGLTKGLPDTMSKLPRQLKFLNEIWSNAKRR